MEAIPRRITGRSQGESFEHLERGRGAQAADSAIEETREGQVFDEWRKCENGPSEAEDTTYGRCAGECVLNRIAEIVFVGVDIIVVAVVPGSVHTSREDVFNPFGLKGIQVTSTAFMLFSVTVDSSPHYSRANEQQRMIKAIGF